MVFALYLKSLSCSCLTEVVFFSLFWREKNEYILQWLREVICLALLTLHPAHVKHCQVKVGSENRKQEQLCVYELK